MELRFPDASCNPYFAFAAILSAGLNGIEKDLKVPDPMTIDLYGLRTVDVHADEDLFVPGYEYHFIDQTEEPPRLLSQIPEGFAGEPSEITPYRGDASAWLDALPVVQEFRKKVLRRS